MQKHMEYISWMQQMQTELELNTSKPDDVSFTFSWPDDGFFDVEMPLKQTSLFFKNHDL